MCVDCSFWADWRNQCWQMHVDVCAGVRAKLGCFTGGWYAGGCELNLKALLSLSVSRRLDGPSGRETTLRGTPTTSNTMSKDQPMKAPKCCHQLTKDHIRILSNNQNLILVSKPFQMTNVWFLNKPLFWMNWSNWSTKHSVNLWDSGQHKSNLYKLKQKHRSRNTWFWLVNSNFSTLSAKVYNWPGQLIS